jgi:hypothetical protein
MTFDYSRIVKKLSETHMQLMTECHDYLFDSRHECFMIANLKHVYLMIYIHSKNRKYFVFIISKLDQLQLIRMHQESMTASFIMSKLMCRALRKLSNKSSLLQSISSNYSSSLTFYQNDILREHVSWASIHVFKKSLLFAYEVNALQIDVQEVIFISVQHKKL